MPLDLLIHLLTAFAVAVVILTALRRVAGHIGLVDQPDERKHHAGAVPLVGGIAMFIAFGFAALILDGSTPGLHGARGFFAGALVLVFVGVLDDLHELGANTRFAAQIVAALLMVWLDGAVLRDLGPLLPGLGSIQLGLFAIPFTVFATVGVINALNMIDGVDGLAGSVTLVAVAALALLAFYGGNTQALWMLALLGGTLLAFLLFNFRFTPAARARVFMGDAGSMFLGFALCWFFIRLSQGEGREMEPVVALWIFALPLIDTVTMMLRRIMKGKSPFAADREHFHHLLLRAGFGDRTTVLIILALSTACAGLGVAGQHFGATPSLLFLLFAAGLLAYFFTIRHAWKMMRFLRRHLADHRPAETPKSNS